MSDIRYQPPVAALEQEVGRGTVGRFSMRRCIEDGWRGMQRNLLPWLGLLLLGSVALMAAVAVHAICGAICGAFMRNAIENSSTLGAIVYLPGVVGMLLYLLLISVLFRSSMRLALDALERQVHTRELLAIFGGTLPPALRFLLCLGLIVWVPFLSMSLLFTFSTSPGSGALGVVGLPISALWLLVASVRLSLAWAFFVDRGLGSIRSVFSSWAAAP